MATNCTCLRCNYSLFTNICSLLTQTGVWCLLFVVWCATTWTSMIFNHLKNKHYAYLLFYQHYITFIYIILTQACRIMRY